MPSVLETFVNRLSNLSLDEVSKISPHNYTESEKKRLHKRIQNLRTRVDNDPEAVKLQEAATTVKRYLERTGVQAIVVPATREEGEEIATLVQKLNEERANNPEEATDLLNKFRGLKKVEKVVARRVRAKRERTESVSQSDPIQLDLTNENEVDTHENEVDTHNSKPTNSESESTDDEEGCENYPVSLDAPEKSTVKETENSEEETENPETSKKEKNSLPARGSSRKLNTSARLRKKKRSNKERKQRKEEKKQKKKLVAS